MLLYMLDIHNESLSLLRVYFNKIPKYRNKNKQLLSKKPHLKSCASYKMCVNQGLD